MGMHHKSDRKHRGRLSISGTSQSASPRASKPNMPEVMRAEANRPISGGGGGKHRGDRRDMSPTYTGNNRPRHGAGFPGPDVSTRKR